MKLLRPIAITGAMLTAASVPENDYAEWSATATYAAGARVIKAATHQVYESAIGGNVGRDPATAGSAAWFDVGPTNRWAMLVPAAGRRTELAATISVTLKPTAPIGAVGLIDVDALRVRVQVSAGGTSIYDRTINNPRGTACTFLDLPAVGGQTIVVTVTPPAGRAAAVGKLVAGTVVDLGTTETGPTIGITDYSRRETDDFGVTTVVERAWAKRISLRSRLESSAVDGVQRQLAAVRATPVLWIGEEAFESLTAYGFFKDFSIDLQLGSTSFCSLTVEGLPSADLVDAGGDPARDRASDLKVIRPLPITDATLASSSATEADHPRWAADTTYAASARVISVVTHRIYESLVAGNAGNDPTSSAGKWLDVGPTNRWAMFDQALGTRTSAPGPLVVKLTPIGAVKALAVLDLDAASVRVQAPNYDRTLSTTIAGAKVSTLTFLDLDVAAGASVTVTIAATSAGLPVSVGTLLLGPLDLLGVTETSPTVTITDYSRKETDDFGNTVPVERAWAKRMAVRSLVASSAIDGVLRRVAALRAKPALWIGQDAFDSLTIYGFFRDFTVELGEQVSVCGLTVEGLSTAAPAATPTVPVVAWPDVSDPDGSKPEDGATVGAPPGTIVGDRPAEDLVEMVDKAKADVGDLFAIYGDTASAAQSAIDAAAARNAAADHETNADAARKLAEQAEADAKTARDAAASARDAAAGSVVLGDAARRDAQAARDAAVSARDAAGGFSTLADKAKTDAQSASSAAATARQQAIDNADAASKSATSASGFATTAQGAATTATQKATNAGQSATASEAQAQIASTKAGEASTSASRAATSETNAKGSENSAASSASVSAAAGTAAERAALASYPTTFEDGAKYFAGAADAANPTNITFGTIDGVPYAGNNALAAAGSIGWKKALPHAAGRTYRVRARVGNKAGAASSARLIVYGHDTVSPPWAATERGSKTFGTPADGMISIEAEFTIASADAFVRPCIELNVGGAGNTRVCCVALEMVDVSSETLARDSAAASAESASTAAARSTAAGQSASAADSARVDAQTARGQAQGFRDQAATSASNAKGSETTASQQAGISTSAKQDAQAAATAASGSASTATSKASDAAQAAAAASASKDAAQTAKGQAEAASSRAATSETNAKGSENSAASSASVSAAAGTAAERAALASYPTTFEDGAKYFAGAADAATPTDITFGLIDGVPYAGNNALVAPGSIGWKKALPHAAGRTYRVRARVGNKSGRASSARLVVYGHDNVSPPWAATERGSKTFATPADGMIPIEAEFTIASADAFVRPCIELNVGGAGNTRVCCVALEMVDITGEKLAQDSAAASAESASTAAARSTAAGQSASAADSAKVDAQTARGQAQGFRDQAATSASNAKGSETTASQQAGISTSAKQDAQAAATAASGSASTATSKASDAAQAAAAASASKDAAQTAKGQAEAASSRAATSETNAKGSENSAASSASVSAAAGTAAERAALASYPTTFEDGGRYFIGSGASSGIGGDIEFETRDGVTYARNSSLAGQGNIGWRRAMPHKAGNTYRVRARVGNFQGQASTVRILVYGHDTNLPPFGNTVRGPEKVFDVPADGFAWRDFELTFNDDIAFVRPVVHLSTTANTYVRCSALEMIDITSEVASRNSAKASADSASTATARSGEAGDYASSSNQSKIAAETARSQAQGFRDQAATSASNAAGSESAASQSAGIAATARDTATGKATDADRSAGAAAQSASTAAAKATDAGQAATSATTAKNAAETAKGLAEAAQARAATSESNAKGSESAASSNALVAASAQSAAERAALSANPTTFEDRDKYFVGPGGDATGLGSDISFSTFTGGTANGVMAAQNNALNASGTIGWKNAVPHASGNTYRVRALVGNSQGAAATARLILFTHDKAQPPRFAAVVGSQNRATPGNDTAWIDAEFTVSSTRPFIRPAVELNVGGTGNTRVRLLALEMINITSEKNSRDSADASASSASTASAKATEAGQSATSATTAKNAAETAQGKAEASESRAATSASGAAGSASSAQSSANLAADYATGSRTDSAKSQASAAAGSATIATAQAAAARSSAVLSASAGIGAINPNPVYADWPEGQWGPSGYDDYTAGSFTRVAGLNSANGWKHPIAAGAASGLQTIGNAARPALNALTPGVYVLEADVTLDAGDLSGAGAIVDFINPAATGTYTRFTVSFVAELGTLGTVGRTYRVRAIIDASGVNAAYTRGRLFMQTGWSGHGTITAKTLTWHKFALRVASAAEAKTGKIDNLEATVSQQAGVLAEHTGKLAAYIENTVAAGGSSATVRLVANGKTSGIGLQADSIVLGSEQKPALLIENGQVRVQGKLSADNIDAGVIQSTNGVTKLDLTTGRLITSNGSVMKVTGNGFGSNNQFVEWFGPVQSSLSNCTEANGIFYFKTDGSGYFGGSLSAGVRKNAVQTSGSRVSTGVIESGGRPRKVVVSYSYTRQSEQNSVQTAGTGSSSTVVRLLRGTTEIGRFTATGSWRRTSYGGQANPATYEESLGGSLTVTDSSGGTQVEYTAELVTTSYGPGPSGTPTQDGIGQNLSIVETEE